MVTASGVGDNSAAPMTEPAPRTARGIACRIRPPPIGPRDQADPSHCTNDQKSAPHPAATDPNFRGGARAALNDLNGDGKADLLVAAGFGGGPRLALYDGSKLGPTGGPKFVGDFFVFEQTLRNGVFIAAGDVNGDGFADVIVGGPNGPIDLQVGPQTHARRVGG